MNIFLSLFFCLATLASPNEELLKTTDEQYQYIYLVRTGESVFKVPNEEGVRLSQGKLESIPLSEKGSRQGEEIGQKLKEKLPEGSRVAIVSSSAKRSSETALNIFNTLSEKYPTQLGQGYPELLGLGKGKWEGEPKTQTYYKERRAWKKLSSKEKWESPKVSTAESYKEVAERALPILQEISDQYNEETVFVVTHLATMNAIDHAIRKSYLSGDFKVIPYDNGDMLVIKVPKGKPISDATVEKHITK